MFVQTISIQKLNFWGKVFIRNVQSSTDKHNFADLHPQIRTCKDSQQDNRIGSVHIRNSVATAAEKVGFLGELSIPVVASSKKAKPCYSFPFMGGYVCVYRFSRRFSFLSCAEQMY